MKSMTGQEYSTDTRLMALIIDLIQNYIWMRMGKQGDPPTSLFKEMSCIQTEEFGFDSVEDFNAARNAIINS